ncbi:MAG TPA: LPFR motif small protein [Streptomyces sp.]|nr:LPFR motif small protein [Streptomyces sp.]
MLAAIVGAIQTVLSAILTVVTLPFRLVARLFGGAKRRA